MRASTTEGLALDGVLTLGVEFLWKAPLIFWPARCNAPDSAAIPTVPNAAFNAVPSIVTFPV